MKNLHAFSFFIALFSGACVSYKTDLPKFSLNSYYHNDLIYNRYPDYGISGRDGCVRLGEISLSVRSLGKDSLAGTVEDSKTHLPLPYCSVKLFAESVILSETKTDSLGSFGLDIASSKPEILQVTFIGYRTLKVDIRDLNLQGGMPK